MNYTPNTYTEKKHCRFCEKDHYGSQRVCRNCIERYSPKLSLFWIFFGLIFSAGIISVIYYLGIYSANKLVLVNFSPNSCYFRRFRF